MSCTHCGHHNQKLIFIVSVFKHFRFRIVEHYLICYSKLGAYITERKILRMNVWHFQNFILIVRLQDHIRFFFFFSTVANCV